MHVQRDISGADDVAGKTRSSLETSENTIGLRLNRLRCAGVCCIVLQPLYVVKECYQEHLAIRRSALLAES